jgi:hypothetical protein
LVQSLPAQPHPQPTSADDFPEAPEGLLLRLLRNRNIRPHNAYILAAVGGGPYVSDATIAGLGSGHVVITPQYMTAFAHLLGYSADDMVALAGVGPAVKDAPVHPASHEMAVLAWKARRLTSDQIAHVLKAAREIE